MFIVLHCGGMAFNGNTIKEKSLGGSETAAYYVAKHLSRQGHKVTVFTNSQEEGIVDGVRYVWAGNVSEQSPLGELFDIFAMNTPHDVLVIQRHTRAFTAKYLSKVNFWWLHDLALYRSVQPALSQLYNIDKVLCVSEFHKNQVSEVYGIEKEAISVLNNGIDMAMYENAEPISGFVDAESGSRQDANEWEGKFKLLYSSRPERGLENLVKPGGVMERLLENDINDVHLFVCGYDNTTPQMKQYYEMLWERCAQLPNVTNLGALTKDNLARLQKTADLYCYPTTFEETSCITAMESMAANIPFLSSRVAALPETCAKNVDSGSILITPKDENAIDVERFVKEIVNLKKDSVRYDKLVAKQKNSAQFYDWSNTAIALSKLAEDTILTLADNKVSVARQMIRNSNIMRLKKMVAQDPSAYENQGPVMDRCLEELDSLYKFADSDEAYDKYYNEYYAREDEVKHVSFNLKDLETEQRFRTVNDMVSKFINDNEFNELPKILDYGCAHGHYSLNLAVRHKGSLHVTGMDISTTNIKYAEKNRSEAELTNAVFVLGHVKNGVSPLASDIKFDMILLGEILEHVPDPHQVLNALKQHLNPGGIFIITTPFGPWEAIGYEKEHPWRAHLWHFDREEIYGAFQHLPQFDLKVAPSMQTHYKECVGSYIYKFDPTEEAAPFRDFLEVTPVKHVVPRQTVSACIIAKDAEDQILACLKSIAPYVDEIIIGIDKNTTDRTAQVVEMFNDGLNLWPHVHWFEMSPATEVGFDAARNETIERASCDWVFWLDCDEVLFEGQYINLHTRNSPVKGYMVPQHHFAVEPLGLVKTDLPVRLFRNHEGVQFFGRVHEHPEKKVNEGVGLTLPASNFNLAHNGYTTETERRARFSRNLPLMTRNREELDRTLDKLLWVRDLSQMCQFEIERGIPINDEMHKRADRGISLWNQLVDEDVRMAVDSLGYYSTLCRIKGKGFEVSGKVAIGPDRQIDPDKGVDITGHYYNQEHFENLVHKIVSTKVEHYEKRYY